MALLSYNYKSLSKHTYCRSCIWIRTSSAIMATRLYLMCHGLSLERNQSIYKVSNWTLFTKKHPDSKVDGANLGLICGRQDTDGPHAGPMDFVIWEYTALLWDLVETDDTFRSIDYRSWSHIETWKEITWGNFYQQRLSQPTPRRILILYEGYLITCLYALAAKEIPIISEFIHVLQASS